MTQPSSHICWILQVGHYTRGVHDIITAAQGYMTQSPSHTLYTSYAPSWRFSHTRKAVEVRGRVSSPGAVGGAHIQHATGVNVGLQSSTQTTNCPTAQPAKQANKQKQQGTATNQPVQRRMRKGTKNRNKSTRKRNKITNKRKRGSRKIKIKIVGEGGGVGRNE